MKWIAISGSCRIWNEKVEEDVRITVRSIIKDGDYIVTGGATGVDYIATDEIIKLNALNKLKIHLPESLETYLKHYKNAGEEWDGISLEKGLELVKQLEYIASIDKSIFYEFKETGKITQEDYDRRDSETIKLADELYAFRVNNSYGTSNTIRMAQEKKIPVHIIDYEIK